MTGAGGGGGGASAEEYVLSQPLPRRDGRQPYAKLIMPHLLSADGPLCVRHGSTLLIRRATQCAPCGCVLPRAASHVCDICGSALTECAIPCLCVRLRAFRFRSPDKEGCKPFIAYVRAIFKGEEEPTLRVYWCARAVRSQRRVC
jgi:hypothetical protein